MRMMRVLAEIMVPVDDAEEAREIANAVLLGGFDFFDEPSHGLPIESGITAEIIVRSIEPVEVDDNE